MKSIKSKKVEEKSLWMVMLIRHLFVAQFMTNKRSCQLISSLSFEFRFWKKKYLLIYSCAFIIHYMYLLLSVLPSMAKCLKKWVPCSIRSKFKDLKFCGIEAYKCVVQKHWSNFFSINLKNFYKHFINLSGTFQKNICILMGCSIFQEC